jgi:hypothetical protein
MTERSAEQAPVQTRPDDQDDRQDTTRVPLAERLQRRISAAAEERRASGEAPRESGRVLPPPPPELQRQESRPVQAVPSSSAAEHTAPVPVQRTAPTAAPAAAPAPSAVTRAGSATRRTPASARGPRRARLRLSRIDPWSVMKVSFLLSIAFGIVTVVSVFMIWSVLGAAGVWTSINNTVSDTVSSGNNTSTFNIEDYLGMSRVLGFTMLVSVIDVILITAIATLGAFLYNMAASLLGGIEVTLAEDS